MPDWLAHLLVPICREAGGRGQAAAPRPLDPAPGQGPIPAPPRTHLEPDDAMARLHGGVVKVALLLLRVFDPNVHATLQPLRLGLKGRGAGSTGEGQPPRPCVPGGRPTCHQPPRPRGWRGTGILGGVLAASRCPLPSRPATRLALPGRPAPASAPVQPRAVFSSCSNPPGAPDPPCWPDSPSSGCFSQSLTDLSPVGGEGEAWREVGALAGGAAPPRLPDSGTGRALAGRAGAERLWGPEAPGGPRHLPLEYAVNLKLP